MTEAKVLSSENDFVSLCYSLWLEKFLTVRGSRRGIRDYENQKRSSPMEVE
jgi:hypothetical protein